MKIIPYILYLFLLTFHLTILSDLIDIYGAAIDLAVLMVCIIALYKSEVTALWFAISAAIVAGTLRLDLMPWEIFLLAGAALMINKAGTRINLDSMTSRLGILGGFLFVHNVPIAAVITSEDFLFVCYRHVLPGAIYSLFVGWIIFQIINGRITWKKIKALF